jgi:hypothetical protein
MSHDIETAMTMIMTCISINRSLRRQIIIIANITDVNKISKTVDKTQHHPSLFITGNDENYQFQKNSKNTIPLFH